VKSDTEVARVNVLDVTEGGAGTRSTRSALEDWADAARPALARARRRGRGVIRFEWPGALVGDPFAPGAEVEPAPWVDVIHALDGGAMLRVRMALRDGRAIRTQFEVHDDGGDEVTARYLRRLGHGDLLDGADRALERWTTAQLLGPGWQRVVTRPGRRGRDSTFYAEWARRYVTACQVEPGAPIRRLVDDETAAGRHATPAQIRAYLGKARQRGLLTDAGSGTAGGALTPEGLRALGLNEGGN
jgi:hypothetical protein